MARYDSFLLRVWRSSRRDGRQFSARIEHLQDGQSVTCLGVDDLLAHLREALEAEPDTPLPPGHDVPPSTAL